MTSTPSPTWRRLRAMATTCATPLHQRLRAIELDRLVTAALAVDDDALPPDAGPAVVASALITRLAGHLAVIDHAAYAQQKQFRVFATTHSRATSPAERLELVQRYLRETVVDRTAQAKDLDATLRYLDADALRERNNHALLALSIDVELTFDVIAGALARYGGDLSADDLAIVSDGPLIPRALDELSQGARWQTRWAAGRVWVAVAGLPALAPTLATPASASALATVAQQRDDHPWVQAVALEALLALRTPQATTLLVERITTPSADPLDLFVRKLALGLAARTLPPPAFAELVQARIEAVDPSEHVRLALVDATTALPDVARATALRQLADDASEKVVAKAALAAQHWLATLATAQSAPDTTATATALAAAEAVLLHVTASASPFAAITACQALAAVAADLAAQAPATLAACAPRWLAALHALITRDGALPRVIEHAAAAAEEIDRERWPARKALTQALAKVAAGIPVGRRGHLDLRTLEPAVAELARDPDALGRVMADLTRRAWGLSARLAGDRVTLWRGDRFRRRGWRILHELRNPLPNKRQAWLHTVGRTYPGLLRAHPGDLDEATATTVPGERVTVDSEGSWARHLPLVDDALALPWWSGRAATVYSSLGATTVIPPTTRWQRLRTRLHLSWRYRELAALRLTALRTYRDRNRRRYSDELRSRYGVQLEWRPHRRDDHAPTARDVNDLFSEAAESAAPTVPAAALALAPLAVFDEFWRDHGDYFKTASANSQAALAIFVALVITYFVGKGFFIRRGIERDRAALPLSIGGWGTRGKSGTERLKAGLLDGLGYEVFVKTTGCEAMFIHSAPMQQPVEIFIYRPYDKASIWEQRALLRLGARLGTDVFLWECMALNPRYVQQLQHDWMRDDLCTLTNCYPDHEDIQGPAGFNVANVITEFIPKRSTLITSETSYLPLFEDVARARGTTMYTIGERDAELIANDVLDLFPYREHPRNIALVTRVAHELGLDPDLARLTMAQCVVPDMGVLKVYGPARVRGRDLTFVCGNSANERTGFVNNWRRMKLDRMDQEGAPHKLVLTVVNNRADRVARSEVFARILVRDVAFDRHVLIGTNLKGLRGFIETALDTYLAELSVIEPDEVGGQAGPVPDVVAARMTRQFEVLRVPPAEASALTNRIAIWARGCQAELTEAGRTALTEAITAALARDGSIDWPATCAEVAADAGLAQAVAQAYAPAASPTGLPESLATPAPESLVEFIRFDLARMMIRARVEREVRQLFAAPSAAARAPITTAFAAAWRAMFLAQVITIEDSAATGDQIIERCALAVPPGTEVTLMGTQNIKGTGLDFVYRWIALDRVMTCVREQEHRREGKRLAALSELEGFEDHGLVDAALIRHALAQPPTHPAGADELAARQRIVIRADGIWQRRQAALTAAATASQLDNALNAVEGWIDWIDSIRRTRSSKQILDDLVARRISHNRASMEMRALVDRVKGGWLRKSVRKRLAARAAR